MTLRTWRFFSDDIRLWGEVGDYLVLIQSLLESVCWAMKRRSTSSWRGYHLFKILLVMVMEMEITSDESERKQIR